MDTTFDMKNIAGLFPISQQILGLYEIVKGLYDIIAIVVEAVKELFNTNRKKDDIGGLENHTFMRPDVNNLLERKKHAIAIEPFVDLENDGRLLFPDEEIRSAIPTPEPQPTSNFVKSVGAVVVHTQMPLMSSEEKDASDSSEEPFLGTFKQDEFYFDERLKLIQERRAKVSKNFDPANVKIYPLKLPSFENIEFWKNFRIPSTWDIFKDSITRIGVGILYLTPIVGTIYSGTQLAKHCCKNYSSQEMNS